VALLATQLMEFIRDGRSVAELMDLGRRLLGSRQVMPGVAAEMHEVGETHTLRTQRKQGLVSID
jgi:urease gamma subunit